jgi:two-component system nitrate/nitrite response regulator NarL
MRPAPLTLTDSRIRILLIGPYALFRAALRALLETRPGFVTVGEAATCSDAAAASLERPDVIVLCLDEDEGGLGALPDLLATFDGARLLILAEDDGSQMHQRAARLGALGFVATRQPPEILLKAIEKVHGGEVWFDRAMLAQMLAGLSGPKAAWGVDSEVGKIDALTKREREVVRLVAEGLRNKLIADRLFISEVTVRHHLTSVFGKLGVGDRQELMLYALRHGLASPFSHSPGDLVARGARAATA